MLLSSSSKRIMAACVALALGLSLSACQIRPLYSSTTASGQDLATELSSVEIAQAKTRLEQEVRNNLIFALTGGGEAVAPAYKLVMKVTRKSEDLSIESGTGLAKTTRISLTADYQLIKKADNSVATTGSSFFTASFARSNQRFSNDRASLDTENRAAEQVANDIQLRLSAFFAAGT